MLTIQRQFSLPNCILILEGLNADGTETSRPLLSTLTRFECHFGNESQIIQGGRDLLNLLAQRVHIQAQSLLSGIKSKPAQNSDHGLTIQPEGQGNFRLTITNALLQSADSGTTDSDTKDSGDQNGLELKLNSVQLFDLVEAFDQLMEDTQTLPDLTLKLSPLSRKEAQSQGTGQKFIPVSLGVASLALIAAISFVIPAPEISKPTAPNTEETIESPIESTPKPDSKNPAGDDTSQDPEAGTSEDATPSSVIEINPTDEQEE